MDEHSQEVVNTASENHAQVPRSYSFLLRLSRRLGTVATKSSFVNEVRTFMNQEITITPPDHLFGRDLPKISRGTDDTPVSKPEEAHKSDSKAADKAEKKEKDLRTLVQRSHEVLMSANTVFPITLFPDTVTVDRTKVTITRRDFFWSSDVLSIRIEDVLNVQASVGPLFGSLTLASRVMSTIDHFQIRHLWRSDAIRLKHIVQGYVIAQHNKIDTAHLSKEDLIETLVELGLDSN